MVTMVSQDPERTHLLAWCEAFVGPCEQLSSDLRSHGRTDIICLRTRGGVYYLKYHREQSFWENEVHGYERWAPVFGDFAPHLAAVHETVPLALLVSELPGVSMRGAKLTVGQEQAAWRSAGRALFTMHEHTQGKHFGFCRRDESSASGNINDPEVYLNTEFEQLMEVCRRNDLLTESENSIIMAARELVPAFSGVRPVPCHRDYGPDNWLVREDSTWSGVIDFEFAHWDVRANDFSRYPHWEWIHRPDLLDAFFEGYGGPLTAGEETQCLVTRTLYALGAVVWGHKNEFFGFAAEGREALGTIANLLRP